MPSDAFTSIKTAGCNELEPTRHLIDTETIGELRHVSKSYITDGGREYKVLDQIDLAVKEGELLALLGQSGSGKSTILRCLTGLLKPTAGRVLCYGEPLEGSSTRTPRLFSRPSPSILG